MSAYVENVTDSSLLRVTSVFFYLLIPAAVLWITYFRMSRKRLYDLAEKLPGPNGFPLIGSAHEFIGLNANEMFDKILKRSQEYMPTSAGKMWIGPRLIVFLVDPRDIEIILNSHVHIDKAPEYRFFEPWLGEGLLISSGERWRAHRKLIAPTFHLNVLKSFIDLFNENSKMAIQKMRKEGNKEFDVHHYMSECTVEILLETAMGVDKKTQRASAFEYANSVMKMCNILQLRQTKIWLRPDIIFNFTKYGKEQTKLLDFIHGLTSSLTTVKPLWLYLWSQNVASCRQVLRRKKEAYLAKKQTGAATNSGVYNNFIEEDKKGAKKENGFGPNVNEVTGKVEGSSFGQSAGLKDDLDIDYDDVGEKKRQAFLDLLIESSENGVILSDDEVRQQVDTIMFEGHDTTASGASFFLCVMGARHDIQEKVVEELQGILGDSDRPITFQDTVEMKYLERCIMETLRMYPPVPIIARELNEEVKLKSSNLSVPAGCTVVIGTYTLHRNPTIYPNPDEFNPDNFLFENAASRHYYAYVPFSAGPRSCVGRKYAMLKLKILLAKILRNFKVYSDTKQEDWKLQGDIILKRADGFNIRLEPRKITPKSV